MLRLISDYQFIGPEDRTLDKPKGTLMSGNLDVLKLYDV